MGLSGSLIWGYVRSTVPALPRHQDCFHGTQFANSAGRSLWLRMCHDHLGRLAASFAGHSVVKQVKCGVVDLWIQLIILILDLERDCSDLLGFQHTAPCWMFVFLLNTLKKISSIVPGWVTSSCTYVQSQGSKHLYMQGEPIVGGAGGALSLRSTVLTDLDRLSLILEPNHLSGYLVCLRLHDFAQCQCFQRPCMSMESDA